MNYIQRPYHFYTMDQRGGLREAVETMKEITESEYKYLSAFYRYYCYDERIECLRYIYSGSAWEDNKPFYILVSSTTLPTIKELCRRFLKRK